MTQELELTGPAGTLTFDESDLIAKDLEKVPTGIGTARIDVPENDSIIPFVQRQDRVNYRVDGTTVFTGYAVGFAGNERTGRWTLRVDGIGKRLEETRPDYGALGGSLTYSNIALDDALADYWDRTPFNATVTPQTENTVAEDEEIQSAETTAEWQSITTIADDTPLTAEGDQLELEQIAWTAEGEDRDNDSGGVTGFNRSELSNGSGFGFTDSSSNPGDFLEWDFTPEYDISSDFVGVQVRDWDDDSTLPGLTWTLDGNEIDVYPQGAGLSLGWREVGDGDISNGAGYTGGDLQAGQTYTLRVELDAISAGQEYIVDVVAPYDERYGGQITFDNSVDANGYLSGPELYPESVDVELNTVSTSFNIAASTVNTVWNDTSNQQSIAVSNDDGATYTTFNNTENATHEYADVGRDGRVRFTFSRYGSRTTATPTQGFNGQSIDSYSHLVDLSQIVVIDELELSRNHFDNLKKLHDYGDFVYTIEHNDGPIGDLTVNSYPRGAITKPTPAAFDDPENINPEVAAGTYFNSVYLQGALQSDGTRPTAEVKDDDAIASDGREISPGVLRDPSISTESGATFRANALLQTALEKNDLRGEISTYPTYVQPGYSYAVDFGEGANEKTLERIRIRESAGSLSASYQFVVKEELAETLNSLKQNSRDQGDQV